MITIWCESVKLHLWGIQYASVTAVYPWQHSVADHVLMIRESVVTVYDIYTCKLACNLFL